MIKLPAIDTLSFWIGFCIASLFWLIISGLRQVVKRLITTTREHNQQKQLADLDSLESILLSSVVKRAQKNHLASCFFPLDAILISPSIFIPFPELSGEDLPDTLLTDYIPYLPSFPQVTASYGYPRCSLMDAMRLHANLSLVGTSGSGKTVALADIATRIARREPGFAEFQGYFPIYLHVLDLNLSSENKDPSEILSESLSAFIPEKHAKKILHFLSQQLESRSAVLILDGLDELPPEQHVNAMGFITSLMDQYPTLPMLITAHPNKLGNTGSIGFTPVLLAPWTTEEHKLHNKLWNAAWNATLTDTDPSIGDPRTIDGLLKGYVGIPFYKTLTLILLYTTPGNVSDSSSLVSAWLEWLTEERVSITALKNLAMQMFSKRQIALPLAEAAVYLQTKETKLVSADQPVSTKQPMSSRKGQIRGKEEIVEYLSDHGLLRLHPSGQISFINPLVIGFLADLPRELMSETMGSESFEWIVAEHVLGNKLNTILPLDGNHEWISFADLPLLRPQLFLMRNLFRLPTNHPLRESVLGDLIPLLLDDSLPFMTRVNLVAAIVESKEPASSVLFRKLLSHKSDDVIRLGALGLGLLKEYKALPELIALTGSLSAEVSYTSTMAIASIGTPTSMKTLVDIFLNGEENHRRLTAELFSTGLVPEGAEILKEGVGLEDIITRRAAVFGLATIREPWAHELLDRIVVEDSQWIVRNAAGQALEALNQHLTYVPKPTPKPWLLETAQEWARKKGESLAPGEFPASVFAEMVERGSLSEQRVALQYLSTTYSETGLLAIYNILYGNTFETLQNQAVYALWKMAAIGIPIPPPKKYGLG